MTNEPKLNQKVNKMAIINLPYMYVPDPTKGRPLWGGKIYIGELDTDPRIFGNQKTANLIQEDGTAIPVNPSDYPILINNGGVPTYNGSPVAIDVDGDFSIAIDSNKDAQVYYYPNYEGGGDDSIFAVVSNTNLITPNPGFSIASPDTSQPAPDTTPRDYTPGYEVFSGWFAGEQYGVSGLTYIDGKVTFADNGFNSLYWKVPKSGDLQYVTEVAASIAINSDGAPLKDANITVSDEGDYWLVTLTGGTYFSAKLEQGDKATKHEVIKYYGLSSAGGSGSDIGTLDHIYGQKFIPDGTYSFNDENLNEIENIELFKNAQVNNSIYDGVMQKDAGVSWLHHNHLEEGNDGSFQAVTSGNIPSPPLYDGLKQNHTNVMAFWYQDFGLDAVRQAQGAIGSVTWYYWDWLFHGAPGDGYEAKRHPFLGYYRGDDPKVSDWQCYWLLESGVTSIIPQTRGTGTQIGNIRATWQNTDDVNHWMYQLFNNAPNFKQLNYSLWFNQGNGVFGDTQNQADMTASFDEIVAIYNQYQNVNTYREGGKLYAVVFCWDITKLSGTFDNFSGYNNTKLWLLDQTAKFQANGFDGLVVLGRNNSTQLVGDADLASQGLLVYSSAYVDTYNKDNNGGVDPAVTYQDLAQGVDVRVSTSFAYNHSVPAISTDRDSHSKHPTTWDYQGSSPELFEVMARNCLKRMELRGSPRMMMIYNVSEWAEGGAALNANMRDGKGYLNALRNALNTVSQNTKAVGYNDSESVNGLTFPESSGTGIASSNTMSDYEEGEFTPIVSDASSGGNTGIPSLTYGFYTRIGRMVNVVIQLTNINTAGMTGTNELFVQGLPFTTVNVAGTQRYIGSVRLNSVNYNGQVYPETEDTATWVKFIDIVSGGNGDYLTVQDLISGQGDIYMSLSYFAD